MGGSFVGSVDNDSDCNIGKATFGSSFGSGSFGNVAEMGLSEAFVRNDPTIVGSLNGGGDLGNVDLIYIPEPLSLLLALLGIVGLLHWRRRPNYSRAASRPGLRLMRSPTITASNPIASRTSADGSGTGT